MKYPFLDLATVNAPYFEALTEAAQRVIRSGRYVGGEENERFESMLAQSAGVAHVVGVSNGLDALRLIFKAYVEMGRLAPGDAVIVPGNTYIASVLAVTDAGLTPVFVDADIRTLNMDTSLLEEAWSPKVRAVLTVHLYGRLCCDDRLKDFCRRHGLLLVEDAAQAIGAECGNYRAGSCGDAAAFSFYPTKNVGALGDAGAVLTNDAELVKLVHALANYGSDRRYHNIYKGYNCRLDPIQAAFVQVKLGDLDKENRRRRTLAAVYDSCIESDYVLKPAVDSPDGAVWHQYAVLSPCRDALRAYLDQNGVGTDINYPTPPHKQPCYSEYSDLRLPVSERIGAEVLSLPISACTSEDDAREISQIINSFRP